MNANGKREQRLAAAVAEATAEACRRWPDEGTANQRRRADHHRDGFIKGVLWWRYSAAVNSRDAARDVS